MIADIDETQAPLIVHLVELRRRLIYAVIGLICACLFGFFVAEPIYEFLIAPLENTYHDWRLEQLAELAADNPDMPVSEREAQVPDFELINLNVIEPFITKLKLSLAIGFAISFPLVAAQLYAFVAPGLYRNEKRALLPFLAATPVLFTAGASLVYYVVMPLAWRFLLNVQQGFGSVLQQTMSSYLSIVIQMILAFGISFQMPVILVLLGKVGIISSNGLRKFRKYAVVGIFAFAALVTPPDFISQVVLGLPMMALYELSVWGVRLVERKRVQDDGGTPPDDPGGSGSAGDGGPKPASPSGPNPSDAQPEPAQPPLDPQAGDVNAQPTIHAPDLHDPEPEVDPAGSVAALEELTPKPVKPVDGNQSRGDAIAAFKAKSGLVAKHNAKAQPQAVTPQPRTPTDLQARLKDAYKRTAKPKGRAKPRK